MMGSQCPAASASNRAALTKFVARRNYRNHFRRNLLIPLVALTGWRAAFAADSLGATRRQPGGSRRAARTANCFSARIIRGTDVQRRNRGNLHPREEAKRLYR